MVLKLLGYVEHWDDRKIAPGDEWDGEINESLNTAQIIVLLVSINFIASKYIREKEMRAAMERHSKKEAIVLPVLVRVTPQWKNVLGLGNLQALPLKSGAVPEEVIPVSKWTDPDEAWENVISGFTVAIEKFRTTLAILPALPVEPTKPDTTKIAEESAKGLQAVHARMETEEVRLIVENFRSTFEAARKQIAYLGDLKDLHDYLHTLQFQCYSFALNESRRAADQVDWSGLVNVETGLEQLGIGIQETSARATLANVDLAWVSELAAARTELRGAVDSSDAEQLKRAARRIGRVLALEPFKINLQLSAAVRALPLAGLESGVARVRDAVMTRNGATQGSPRLDRGVTALSLLRGKVENLTKEHNQWQEIDAEMRRIEGQLTQDVGDLEFAWEGLKKRLLVLCGNVQERWAVALRDEIQKLEAALAASVQSKIVQAFRRVYSQAGARFYDVDYDLKVLCDELRKVGSELEDILNQPS